MPGPKPASRPKYRLKENKNFLITKELVKSHGKRINELNKKAKTPEDLDRLRILAEKTTHAKTELRDFILRDYLAEKLKKSDSKYKAKVFDEVNKIYLIKDKLVGMSKHEKFDNVIKAIFRDLRGFEKTNGASKLKRKSPVPDDQIYEYLRERRIILEHSN